MTRGGTERERERERGRTDVCLLFCTRAAVFMFANLSMDGGQRYLVTNEARRQRFAQYYRSLSSTNYRGNRDRLGGTRTSTHSLNSGSWSPIDAAAGLASAKKNNAARANRPRQPRRKLTIVMVSAFGCLVLAAEESLEDAF